MSDNNNSVVAMPKRHLYLSISAALMIRPITIYFDQSNSENIWTSFFQKPDDNFERKVDIRGHISCLH